MLSVVRGHQQRQGACFSVDHHKLVEASVTDSPAPVVLCPGPQVWKSEQRSPYKRGEHLRRQRFLNAGRLRLGVIGPPLNCLLGDTSFDGLKAIRAYCAKPVGP